MKIAYEQLNGCANQNEDKKLTFEYLKHTHWLPKDRFFLLYGSAPTLYLPHFKSWNYLQNNENENKNKI